ncbi:protein jagged-1a-like [Mytilus californianus]|uniref:protein jagged-1a-like n=1 Tax=Mytilus californianus TaxID=6549 RepID=UPI002245C9C3|nr:protein jagged-1a-like [Mytilus californianus]
METAKIISFNVWIVLLIFQYQIEDSYCKGKISLKLLEYNNPTGTDAKGDCCDSPVNVPGCTRGKCDHLFRICLLDSTSRSNTSNCLQSTDITTSDQNVVKFDQNQQNVQFVFDTWKGEAPIKIEVFDSNTDDKNNVLIDQFLDRYNSTKAGFNQTSITAVNFNLIGTRSRNPSSLRFSVSVYCDPQYYGSDCSVKCVPTNKCDGHHTCDHEGNKVFLSGWRGKDCVEQIPGSDVDCSVYTTTSQSKFLGHIQVGVRH